ncbi:MAG TPA: GNAT family N-acetyltransferase [Gemmatimonadaceae bacterium]|nr:GNAT family N-acetyltransferase [Gemmatimonadaceae bacterium]
MSALTIRPAVAADAPTLARMLDQLGYPTEASEIPKRLERMAERPGTTVFVAEQRGAPVGVVTVHLFPSLHTSEPVAWLTALVVEETARGAGVGSALVQRAEEWAARHGASRLALTSALRRTEAHEFYKTRDYVHTGVRLAKELSPQPGGQAARAKSDEFHVLELEHHDEAAAFVAALSRFINSPGNADAKTTKALEVWARSPVSQESVKLYLNDMALSAAQAAFGALPTHKTVSRQSLPDECFLIIGGGTGSWGAEEASARLTQRT